MMEKEIIGDCTLYCGDCLEIIDDLPSVSICIADPPYSSGGFMRSDRSKDPLSKYCNKKYASSFTGDNRDQHSFILWLSFWMGSIFRKMEDGGYFFCFTDWRQIACVSDAVQIASFIYRGIIPWNKTECVRPQKGAFRNQCEYVIYGTKGKFRSGKIMPGFFIYTAPAGSSRVHPTQKPVKVIENLISIQDEGVVLDPFMGSGTTGIACLRNGRKFIGIEQDRYWFDLACERLTKVDATG